MPSGGELLFCAHHGREHEPKLREMGIRFQDDSAALTSTPHTAPDGER
jgi:hypothetical protein